MNHESRARRRGVQCSAMIAAVFACSAVAAQNACLLTPAALQSATSRAFDAGQPARNLGDDSLLCHYAEKDNPQRKLTVGLSATKAKQQFESRLRLLQTSGRSIALKDVGDRAYYNGASAGVLAGDKLISISNLRRAGQPQIAQEKIQELLRAAIEAAGSS